MWLRRAGFEAILAEAVPSTFDPAYYPDEVVWSAAVARSTVRLQWDPDRTPGGGPLGRRAIQLALRGRTLARCATEWILDIEDITDFCASTRRWPDQRRGAATSWRHALRSTGQPALKRQPTSDSHPLDK
jgi:hypothetical protein